MSKWESKNLPCVPNVEMEMSRRVGCRSVHGFRTCKENAAAQCRLPTNLAAKHL